MVAPQTENIAVQMMQMITGYWVSRSLYIVAKLGIPDVVENQPVTIDELAEATGTHAPSLYRLMRALNSVGVFREDENGYFHLTPQAEMLTTNHPQSLRSLTIMFGEETYDGWVQLMHAVKTGETGFSHAYGEEFFPFLAKNPEVSRTFGEAMTGYVAQTHQGVLQTYDFTGTEVLADIGGSHGTLLSLILRRYPDMRGILFDQPHVIEEAKGIMAPELMERCDLVGGDFFQAVPEGADTYMLSSIIHDWDKPRGIQILENVREAIPDDGKLLLVETVIKERNELDFGKLLDLTMLTVTGGLERDAEGYADVLAHTGFQMQNIVTIAAPASVIEAVPV
ncbi:MAG: methyltransferase [Chloroflexota bacterium]